MIYLYKTKTLFIKHPTQNCTITKSELQILLYIRTKQKTDKKTTTR